jgi:hypothetical protein
MAGSGEAEPVAEREATTKRKRRVFPAIDLDASIEKARQAVQDAQKVMREARATARNERRRRARLIRKAASLSAKDLDRIAVLKRCGMWNPADDDAPENKRAKPLAIGESTPTEAAD